MGPEALRFLVQNWPDMLAFITGVLGVWLTIRQNIWCWPMALVSVVVSIYAFYQQRLFGDMSLQVVYFFAGVYGWAYWQRNLEKEFRVTRMMKSRGPILLAATLLQAVVYYVLLVYFGGDRPFLDAVLTAASLTATYMMTKKWVENWAVWVVIDGFYVLLYGLKHMWLFGCLYLFFTLIAFFGWLKWRRQIA